MAIILMDMYMALDMRSQRREMAVKTTIKCGLAFCKDLLTLIEEIRIELNYWSRETVPQSRALQTPLGGEDNLPDQGAHESESFEHRQPKRHIDYWVASSDGHCGAIDNRRPHATTTCS